MSANSNKNKPEEKAALETNNSNKTCFVIMPIANHPDYPENHFKRVYDHIIKPACIKAVFTPDRADDAQHTHVIMMNILQRILDADIAICDLSSKNPNVMYELGIRQAFDKPVTLIKDEKTLRVFDTGMLSDLEYSSDLRIDNVEVAIDAIALRLKNTYDKKDEQVTSLIQLMKVEPAKLPNPTVVSADTTVVLDAIATLGRRVAALEPRKAINDRGKRAERDDMVNTINTLRQRLDFHMGMKASLEKRIKLMEGDSDLTLDLNQLEAMKTAVKNSNDEIHGLEQQIVRLESNLANYISNYQL